MPPEDSDKTQAKGSFNKVKGRELSIKTFPMPPDTIVDDFISAGWLLSQMDLAGGRRSFKYVEGRCVTIGIEAMSFKKPVYLGDDISIYTEVLKEGNTSLRLKVEAWAERVLSGKTEKVTEGTFTFVAIDENRKPVPISIPRTPADKAKALKTPLKPVSRPSQIFNRPACEGSMDLSIRTVPETRDMNYNKDIFGGWILSQMDKACAARARKETGHMVATVGLEAMKFLSPVFVGDEISFYTDIVKTGTTSITIKVESWVQRREGHFEKVTEGMFSYVAVDKNRKPVEVSLKP